MVSTQTNISYPLILSMNRRSNNHLPFDNNSTEDVRRRDVDYEISSFQSQSNNEYLYTPVSRPHQYSTSSSHDTLTYAISLLDLSTLQKPLESELFTPDTTFSNNSDGESWKKMEQRSSLIKIWCEGPV